VPTRVPVFNQRLNILRLIIFDATYIIAYNHALHEMSKDYISYVINRPIFSVPFNWQFYY